ncbi:MAG: 4Fe-4S dicluster domain-containing protein [Isosphaeraceae bacterium]
MKPRPDPHPTLTDASFVGSELPILSAGPLFWRSLDERAENGAPRPDQDQGLSNLVALQFDPSSRREFLRLMAASLALGGLSGCAIQPTESIVPYVEAPEQIVPGKPLFFSTAVSMNGFACGVLVESQMGRPTKIEGNPDHPASLGATDAFAQAAVLSFYDPDRSQVVTRDGRVETWDRFETLLLSLREEKARTKGAGLRILTQTITSPTLADQLRRLQEQFPEAKWHAYEPITRDAVHAGCRQAFGEEMEPVYHLDKADVIVALDADFLAWGPGRLKDARAFAARREPEQSPRDYILGRRSDDAPASVPMNRLYAIECTPTITGASADHRLPIAAQDIAAIVRAIAGAVGVGGSSVPVEITLPDRLAQHDKWIDAMARDLKGAGGRGLVVAGDTQPKEVHALAHLINHALGNVGKTVEYLPRIDEGPADQVGSLRELSGDIDAGAVDTLIILGGNPAYNAPADFHFAQALSGGKISLRIHLGLYDDETAQLCHWHVPEAHGLEAWGDLRAFDGTATIQQPLIAPLYGGKSALEVLALLLGEPGRSGLEIVREYWGRQSLPGDFESAWHQALRTGTVDGTARKPKAVAPRGNDIPSPAPRAGESAGLELVFRPDPAVWDGRFANNAWLQELPRPLTRLTWDNAALISPAQASRLGVQEGDIVELRQGGRKVQIPAYIMPGQADLSITVTLGYGRRRAGRVGNGVGVDVYGLRTADEPWFGSGLEVVKTGRQHRLAATQHHHRMEGREPIRVAGLATYHKANDFAQVHEQDRGRGPSLFDDPAPQERHEEGMGNAWGMAINLNTCTGCGACVAACQAENNIPVVGRDQVLASREMQWIRIDRYFEGQSAENPPIDFQPVACMHCEKAPCEIVCPVGATTHSAEGLNEMTYNRCVGTRYCSNNCPYKVRRFNFFQYSDEETPSLKLMRNPDVTVRPRGVMEKCTYCVQRINEVRIAAEIQDRTVRGDEVVTACQAVCPSRAIVFGDINDKESAVAKAKASPRNYGLLSELNTRPRTTYLAKLRNPNPEIEALTRHDSQRS